MLYPRSSIQARTKSTYRSLSSQRLSERTVYQRTGIRTVFSKILVGSKGQAFLVCLLSLLYFFSKRQCLWIAAMWYSFPFYSPFVKIILWSWLSWKVAGRGMVIIYRRFGAGYRYLHVKQILTSTRLLIRMYEKIP
jgi:hypothetical protein